MKVVLLAFAVTFSLEIPAYSQVSAAYAEFAGTGYFYSVNLEVPIANTRTIRIGGMYLPASLFGATIAANQLVGRGNHNLVLGFGYTFEAGSDIDVTGATATIVYRYARPRGPFFQLAATPFFTKYGAFSWAGVSIGQSF
jgi:hypothetical protein